jgi:hypothetical protein
LELRPCGHARLSTTKNEPPRSVCAGQTTDPAPGHALRLPTRCSGRPTAATTPTRLLATTMCHLCCCRVKITSTRRHLMDLLPQRQTSPLRLRGCAHQATAKNKHSTRPPGCAALPTVPCTGLALRAPRVFNFRRTAETAMQRQKSVKRPRAPGCRHLACGGNTSCPSTRAPEP